MALGFLVSLVPTGFSLAYRDGEGVFHELVSDYFATAGDDRVTVEVAYDGEVGRVQLRVNSGAVDCELFSIGMRHSFPNDELVLFNGYQSWTDTRKVSAWKRVRGLRGVPKPLVDRFALDGGGDYRFTDYSGIPGCHHGWTYATFSRGDDTALVGALDETNGFLFISSDASAGVVSLQPECPARTLMAGECVELSSFAIVQGAEEYCYDRWFELRCLKARPVKPLLGYTSWYRHYDQIDEAKLIDDLAGLSVFMGEPPFSEQLGVQPGESGSDAFDVAFQIDDGYCTVGDWLSVDTDKFPHGLAPLAAVASDLGFVPGLWLAPFVCSKESHLYAAHPEWLLKDENGEYVSTGSHWRGAYALDTRNPEVRTYVLEVLQTATQEWGFKLLKLDFLYAACLQVHGGLNRGQLMADAMDLLRRGADEDCLLLGCGVPLGSAAGKVDYCRIGCDVGLDWDDAPPMRLLHRERVSTKNSLGNTYGRAWLDGRAFGNDPDVFFLRGDDVKMTEGQRDELLFADAVSGSVLLTSDDMGKWTPQMQRQYKAAVNVFLERKLGA